MWLLFWFPVWLRVFSINPRSSNSKCGLYSDFQYGFVSSQSILDLLTVNVAFILISCMVSCLLNQPQLYSDFQYGFMSSQSILDLLTALSDNTDRAFNRSGVTWAVALNISKALDSVWDADLFRKLKSSRIPGQFIGLILSYLSKRQLQVVLNGKSSQEYPVNKLALFIKIPFLLLHFFYYTLKTFLMMSVILLSMLMILLSTLSVSRHLICGNN